MTRSRSAKGCWSLNPFITEGKRSFTKRLEVFQNKLAFLSWTERMWGVYSSSFPNLSFIIWLQLNRSEDAENQSKVLRPEGSSKPQRKRPIPGKSSQNSLDLWLQKKSSVTRTSPARTDLSSSSEERPSTTERDSATEPRRTGSVLVSGDPDANTETLHHQRETRKITHFFTKTPVKVACRRWVTHYIFY